MEAVPYSPATPWRGLAALAESFLRMWRLIIGTLLAAPLVIASLLLIESLLQSRDLVHASTLLVPALCCSLLSLGVALILIDPWIIAAPWRVAVALVLGSPWALLSVALLYAMFPIRHWGLFAFEEPVALAFGAVAICGFRMLVWPSIRNPPWMPYPPDPPLAGAPVLAPLKPPPPTLIAAAAKELPGVSDDSGDPTSENPFGSEDKTPQHPLQNPHRLIDLGPGDI